MMTTNIQEIIKRWRDVPPMRVAKGLDDALNDWPIGDFGEHPEGGHAVWLATDRVRCSEMTMASCDIAEALAHAGTDIRQLLCEISRLSTLLKEQP